VGDLEPIGREKSTARLLGIEKLGGQLAAPALAYTDEFSFKDAEGQLVEVEFDKPALLLSTSDQKGIVIVDDDVLIIVRGGRMKVEARGIVK
jgi:hypothetical protein